MLEPDRILEGATRVLESAVLPELQSGFARGQLQAVLEVLEGLQGQLQWGGMLLTNEAAMLDGVIAQAVESVGGDLGTQLRGYVQTASEPLMDRVLRARELVCLLIEAGHIDGEPPLAEAIKSYLANNTIFHAMALRPGRLAEISQG